MKNKLKILILEDNIDDVNLLKLELRKLDFEVVYEIVQTRETFEKALEVFGPDIILSDYSLPSFDGVTAFHIKQKTHPDIPFILVSGIIGDENAVELIKNGVTDYALKDQLYSLIPKIQRALKEAEDKREKIKSDNLLKLQNDKLFEIAFLQSHEVRKPVANILGILDLINEEDPGDPENIELIPLLLVAAKELDSVINQIVQKTNEIKNML